MQPTETPERAEVVEYYVSRGSVPSVPRSTALELAKPSRALAVLNVLRKTVTSNLVLSLIVIVAHLALAVPWANLAAVTIIFSSRGQDAVTFEVPGPSLKLWTNHPYYTCNTNRYVSTSGLSTNNGLTPATAWDIVTAGNQNLGGGSCINVAPGTYNVTATNQPAANFGGSNATTTGYLVWRCTSMSTQFVNSALTGEGGANSCHIKMTDRTINVVFEVAAPYLMFDGFEFDGNLKNIVVGSVLSDCGGASPSNACGSACFDNSTANLTTSNAAKDHHTWLLNSDVHDCGSVGISNIAQDWMFFIHNVWHDNSYGSTLAFSGSGMSIFESIGLSGYSPTVGNSDYWVSSTTGLTYKVVIVYNVAYNNCDCLPGSTDGEGIIFDSWGHAADATTPYPCPNYSGVTCPYDGAALVMGNALVVNGGQGLEAFDMAAYPNNSGTCPPHCTNTPFTIVNNTFYQDGIDPHFCGPNRTGVLMNSVGTANIFNNISIAGPGPTAALGGECGGGWSPCNSDFLTCPFMNENTQSNTWRTNISSISAHNFFDATATYPTTGPNANSDTNTAPITGLTANSFTNNYALPNGSAAIGFGQAFDLWQQSGSVDVGACVHQLAQCP